jgi:DNA-binding XRE family transcriptional regulator
MTNPKRRQMCSENDLAALAKRFRQQSGVSKAEAARQLGVTRGTIQQAEEYPAVSLTKLRRRMIEAYSPLAVVGPVYLLKRKTHS